MSTYRCKNCGTPHYEKDVRCDFCGHDNVICLDLHGDEHIKTSIYLNGNVDENKVVDLDSGEFEIVKKTMHPLVNPDSKHYQMFDGVESVERLEQMFTTGELMAWAKVTAFKYRMRIGEKDAPEKEVTKIKDYEAYFKYLNDK